MFCELIQGISLRACHAHEPFLFIVCAAFQRSVVPMSVSTLVYPVCQHLSTGRIQDLRLAAGTAMTQHMRKHLTG